MNTLECVQCGYCCTKTPCGFGKWDKEKKQCKFLTIENLCEKYEEIIKDESQIVSPAFGYGCCMSLFNTIREEKIRKMIE